MAPIDALRVALAGFGHVGRALAQILAAQPAFRVVSVSDSQRTVWRPEGVDSTALADWKKRVGRLVAAPGESESPWSAHEAVERLTPDVVVDAMPTDLEGATTGLELLRSAARAGAHVVLADKGPLAVDPAFVHDRFGADGLLVRYGATVGGGIPILETLERLRASDEVLGITAVASGSTTFVLERVERGATLADAVQEATGLGVLEKNPLLDLGGYDAAAKAAILHQTAFGSRLRWREVTATGILGLDEEAIREPVGQRLAVRLVANVSPDGARVAPVAVERGSPLATSGTGNAFVVRLADGETVTVAGPGAGPRATARTILRDLLWVRDRLHGIERPAPRATSRVAA